MNINDQTDALLFELQNVVNRFKDEYDLNHATIVGALEVMKLDYLTDQGDVDFECDCDLQDEIDDEQEF
jgi:hypothetical protein